MKENDILQQSTSSPDELLSTFIPQSGLHQLADVEKMVNQLLATLPKINRNAWRSEMESMSVPIKENPTTYDINEGLALAQGYRDRLSEMLLYAQREYKLRKRCLEMLFDAVNLISKASSADKRRGEASMRYPVMLLQVESAEIFIKEIEMIYNNIKSAADSISRQASVISMQISLGERRATNTSGKNFMENNSPAEEVNREKSWDDF